MDSEQLIKLLDELGNRLTPAAQHAFELAVRQQVIEGIAYIVIGIAILLAAIINTIIALRLHRKYAKESIYTSDDSWFVFTMIAGAFWVFFFVGVVTAGIDIATKIFNPEYAALKDLMETLTGNG